ncbi:unnamed protein product [Rangifer tarandus platyrhynchus]|uniref:Uncharacterized protein n=1 Tax=Rangifer tarandus platyrhynchus TaxID=3082113 RepID=A0ABN8ZFR9_RANTA|nr:unnamed protein product [Rangifer tarandus platyrhynchus]
MVHNEGRWFSAPGAELRGSPHTPWGAGRPREAWMGLHSPQALEGPVSANERGTAENSVADQAQPRQETPRDSGREGSGVRVSANEGNSACSATMHVASPSPLAPWAPPSARPAGQPDPPWARPLAVVLSGPFSEPGAALEAASPTLLGPPVGAACARGTAAPLSPQGGVTGLWASLLSLPCRPDSPSLLDFFSLGLLVVGPAWGLWVPSEVTSSFKDNVFGAAERPRGHLALVPRTSCPCRALSLAGGSQHPGADPQPAREGPAPCRAAPGSTVLGQPAAPPGALGVDAPFSLRSSL